MKVRLTIVITCFLVAFMSLTGCKKEQKQGRVTVKDYQFVTRQDGPHSYAIDAKGTVKNVGSVDVKNIIITGYCNSCGKMMINGQWFISDVEKMPEQKAVISYLTPGAEEPFKFKGVAFMMQQSGMKPEKMPDSMEVKIVSFETVQQ
ncbi:MAG: hypothetical protein GXP53_12760 [Deltaproteobacteria bacterium]|nr:hypothetical protein [Deltaproteobacteria bacterium]